MSFTWNGEAAGSQAAAAYRAVWCDATAQRRFQQLTALVLNAIGLTFKENLYSSGI